jgi:hypothetical protein
MRLLKNISIILFLFSYVFAQNIPSRTDSAKTGSEFMEAILGTTYSQREPQIFEEIVNGNIPNILRDLITLTSTFQDAKGINHIVKYDVMRDYLSIGTNKDYCRIPMGPHTAQAIADTFGCILTTPKLCDDIWKHASVHLDPIPYYPVGDNNSQVYQFVKHNKDINTSRDSMKGNIHDLIAGIKKDIVICNALKYKKDKVAIYGWHYMNGIPIQPLYTGHVDWYVDYSHGVRLVNSIIRVDGIAMNANDILKDPVLFRLISNEKEPMELFGY